MTKIHEPFHGVLDMSPNLEDESIRQLLRQADHLIYDPLERVIKRI